MKNSIKIAMVLSFAWMSSAIAQNTISLKINHQLDGEPFAFNTQTANNYGNEVKYTRVEYYISGISIVHDGGTITPLPDVYLLVNPQKNSVYPLEDADISKVEEIRFHVGVDPKVNNEDPNQWPAGHALRPSFPSMHWGWAAGYRFCAIEGVSGPQLNQTCQVHALGNQNYFKSHIPVSSEAKGGELSIEINGNYEHILDRVDISKGLFEHNEDITAAEVLRNFQTRVFSNAEGVGNTNDREHIADVHIHIFPNPSHGSITMQTIVPYDCIKVLDLSGREVLNLVPTVNSTEARLHIEKAGVYTVKIELNDGSTATEKIVIRS